MVQCLLLTASRLCISLCQGDPVSGCHCWKQRRLQQDVADNTSITAGRWFSTEVEMFVYNSCAVCKTCELLAPVGLQEAVGKAAINSRLAQSCCISCKPCARQLQRIEEQCLQHA